MQFLWSEPSFKPVLFGIACPAATESTIPHTFQRQPRPRCVKADTGATEIIVISFLQEPDVAMICHSMLGVHKMMFVVTTYMPNSVPFANILPYEPDPHDQI